MATMLYVGSHEYNCDVSTVLRAVHSLDGDGDLKIVLAGSGEGRTEISRLVKDLDLQDVESRPPVPLGELPALLAAADIHIIVQRPGTEGLIVPNEIYGALAAGRPVVFIGPYRCEVSQIVRDSGCGFVAAPSDVSSAANASRQLANNEMLRQTMGDRAKKYYAEKLGRKRSVARIVDVIERAAISASD